MTIDDLPFEERKIFSVKTDKDVNTPTNFRATLCFLKVYFPALKRGISNRQSISQGIFICPLPSSLPFIFWPLVPPRKQQRFHRRKYLLTTKFSFYLLFKKPAPIS